MFFKTSHQLVTFFRTIRLDEIQAVLDLREGFFSSLLGISEQFDSRFPFQFESRLFRESECRRRTIIRRGLYESWQEFAEVFLNMGR